MEFPTVQPADRSGGWEVELGHRRRAEACFRRLEERAALLRAEVQRRDVEEKAGRVYQVPDDLLEEYRLFGDATVVFAAMAVEGFLNFYGVLRFGEAFYKNYIERLGIHSKLAAIIAVCTGGLVPDDAELMVTAKTLFERRNALVHPKAREIKTTDPWPPAARTRLADATAALGEMARFFALFMELDPKARSAMR